MDIPFLPYSLIHVNDQDRDVKTLFISYLLAAFIEPTNFAAWKTVHNYLQEVKNLQEDEGIETSTLIHYILKFISYLSCDHIYLQQKTILRKKLQQLLHILTQENTYTLTPDNYQNSVCLKARGNLKPGSHYNTLQDKIFLYNPTSLNSSTPHPHTLSISDLRASLPRVLLQVSQLHRGKYPGLGITAQSLDLALTTSLHLPFPHSTAFTSINTSQVQLWPPTNKRISMLQHSTRPKTGEEVINYFACGGRNRFFYLRHDSTSLCYNPYKLLVHGESQLQNSILTTCHELYIMSAFGIIRKGSERLTESTSLVSWQREATIFRGLKTIPLFRMFMLLKIIRRWKNIADCQRHEKVRLFLLDNLVQQVPYFLPLVYSTSQWGPRLQRCELYPENPAELASIQSIENLLFLVKKRVKDEVIQLCSDITKQVEQMWTSLKHDLSYCEQSIDLEEYKMFLSNGLSLSTQSHTLRLLIKQRIQLLTAIKLIPNLTRFLGIRMHLEIQTYAVSSADSYLNFLNVNCREEDSTPVISLDIGVFNEGERMVLECHSKWSDTCDILLTPFNEHYVEFEHLDRAFFSESNNGERKKIIEKVEQGYRPRETKLTFVRQIVAHSLLTDACKDTTPPEELSKKESRQFRRYEAFLLKRKKECRLKDKLNEATYQQEWKLIGALREANREISTRLDFLKWMEDVVFFIKDCGYSPQYNGKILYSELLEKYEKLRIWTDKLENVPEVWTTENRLFQLDLTQLKSGLNSRLILVAEKMFTVCFDQYKNSYNSFMRIIQETIFAINNSNFEVDSFLEHTLKFDELKEDRNRMQKLKKELDEMYELLQQSPVAHVEDLEEKHAVIMPKWYKYITYLQTIASFIFSRKGMVVQQLRERFIKLKHRTMDLLLVADQDYLTRWTERPQENRALLRKTEDEFWGVKFDMQQCEKQLILLVTKEERISLTDQMREVTLIERNITIRKQLWDSVAIGVRAISEWMKMSFTKLKITEIGPLTRQWKEQLDSTDVLNLAEEEVVVKWKNMLDRFNSILPSLELLMDPGMKTHFWIILFTALGRVYPSSEESCNINFLISLNILNHKELIKHIHASAMVEGRLENIFCDVITTWKYKEYKLFKHDATPFHRMVQDRQENDSLISLPQPQGFTSYLLQDADEILSLINDHCAQLGMIIQSNCTKYLKKRAQLFLDKLQQLADFITTWMDCQTKWIYISSVYVEFALLGTRVSELDIFKEVNTNYQSLVNTLFENLKMLRLIGVRVEDNFQLVEESNYLIGRLLTQQRELSQAMRYLENMAENARKVFSRSFYLSEQHILRLYVHIGNPKVLLTQLRICFPGVDNVMWEVDCSMDNLSSLGSVNRLGVRIRYIYDEDGNNFKLLSPLITGHQPGHFWMKALEKALQVSISETIHRISQCIQLPNLLNPTDNPLTAIISSLHDNPLQCVSVALSIAWTYMIDKSIDEDKPDFLNLLKDKLAQCTKELINEYSSPIEKGKRLILSKLFIHIHNLQYGLSCLQNEPSLSHNNFLWLSNLRYKYTLSNSESDQLIPITAIYHLNYRYPYCNEYQGTSGQLVLTPLTEKCIFNLSLAMYTNKLAGIIGPSCSDASQTVRALCHSIGRACFSLDANAFQTHSQLTSMIVGFIQSGTVGYITNLDRLKPTLSCALVTLLQEIKKQIDNKMPYRYFLYFYDITPTRNKSIDWYSLDEFGLLEELTIAGKILLKHGYGCCVSMSNQNLPEGFSNYLHTQINFFFFSQPNCKSILEAHLLSHCFSSYKVLSCKVIAFLNQIRNLFGKEFESQSIVLRNVIREAVLYLEFEGDLWAHESSKEENEVMAVFYALWKLVKPQLAEYEIILAKNILNTNFPECVHFIGILSQVDMKKRETRKLEKILTRILVEKHYRSNTKEMEKIFDIYNSLVRGQNVVIYGPTLCGKTTCLQLLANALNEMTIDNIGKKIDLSTIYPHGLDIDCLYGSYDKELQRWKHGLLQKLLSFKLFSNRDDYIEREQWFVFDGTIEGDWIAYLHSMLVYPRHFTTCESTIIKLPCSCKFIFETESLSSVPPSFLSHCYPIPIGQGVLSWRDHLDHWLKSITVSQGIAESDVIDLRMYTDRTVATILEYLENDDSGWTKIASSLSNKSLEIFYVRNFTSLMSAMLKKFYVLSYEHLTSSLNISSILEDESPPKLLNLLFVFSLAWGFGGSMDADTKMAFNDFLLNLLMQNKIETGLTSRLDKCIFNYYIEPTKRSLIIWSDRIVDHSSFSSYINNSHFDRLSVIGELLLNNGIPVFYSGVAGCGKTAMVENLLQHRLKLSSLSYSPLWTPLRLQQRIRAMHLAHQKSNNTPSQLEEGCILFIDDLNIATGQKDSGCLDVLRQVMETSLVYDTSTNVMKPVSIQLIICSNSALSLSNSSKANSQNRFYSHFFNLTIDLPNSDTLFKIFSPQVTKWVLSHYPPSKGGKKANHISEIFVKTTIAMFECLREKFKPTPNKPQYSFNLFELNRLFQSMFLFTAKHTDKGKIDSLHYPDEQRNGDLPVTSKRKRRKHLHKFDTLQFSKDNYSRETEDKLESYILLQRSLIRLWYHEHCRVYGDMINDEKDQEWFQLLLKKFMQKSFCSFGEWRSASEDYQFPTKKTSKLTRFAIKKQNPIEEITILTRHTKEMEKAHLGNVKIPLTRLFTVIEEMASLLYFRWTQSSTSEVPPPHTPNTAITPLGKNLYCEVTEFALKTLLEPHLNKLNENLTVENEIVIYPFALEHIVRLSRLMQMFEGHALFCAQRKTGRKTLVRLAASLAQCQLFDMQATIERNSIKDCLPILQEAINSSVISRSHSVVMVSGDWLPEVWHAIGELLSLEIVNPNQGRIPKDGEESSQSIQQRVSPIPGIFKTEIFSPRYPPGLTKNLFKHNLHFVIIINTTPSSFKAFFTNYHKLVRFLTLDIMSPLCELSLREVAHAWLSNNAVNRWVDEEISLEKIGEVAAHIHCTAFDRAKEIYPGDKLWIYKSNIRMFIELLKTSGKLAYVLSRKEACLTREVKKAQINLNAARGELESMREELAKLEKERGEKIEAIKAFKEGMMSTRIKYKNAEQVNKQHAEEIEKCNKIIATLERGMKRQFGEVDPLYEQAEEALRALSKEDIVELTTFKKPPDGVKKIAECICKLFKREISWSSAQELFRTKHFYQNLLCYDKEKNMSTILTSLPTGFQGSEIDVEKIEFSSKAAVSLTRWLIALYRHAKVDQETRGERREIGDLQEEVKRLEKQRGKERVNMNNNNCDLEIDNQSLEEKRVQVDLVNKSIEVIKKNIINANKIFSSLQLVEAKFNMFIRESQNRVSSIGNVLITAGAINYLTPFPSNIICEMVNVWKKCCGVISSDNQSKSTSTIKVTHDFSLLEILTTEEELFYWETKKRDLPQGEDYKLKLLLIRAVACFDCVWPYVYDPTGTFYKWMKSVESTFRGAEIENLFDLTRGYDEAIKISASLPAIHLESQGMLDKRKRAYTPPSLTSKSLSGDAKNNRREVDSLIENYRPDSSSKDLRIRKSWSQIQRRSIVKAIFSTNLHLVRCYDEDFENILESELIRSSPVPIIVLGMSCLQLETSRRIIYSEFEERQGRRYYILDGNQVEVKNGFRLYLTSNYSPEINSDDVANIDLDKIRFCNFEPPRDSVREIIFMILAQVEMGEVQTKLDTATRDVIYFYKMMKEKRKKLLKHIIDSPSIASDLELVKLISTTGRELERAEEGRTEYQGLCDKLQTQLDVLRVVSDNLELVWFALDKMQQLCERKYNFTLSGFLEAFQIIVNRSSAETFRPDDGTIEGRIHHLSGVMLREILSIYLSQLVECDKVIFLLFYTFSIQVSQGNLTQQESDLFFSPIFSIKKCTELLNSLFSEFASNKPSFLPTESWAHITQQFLTNKLSSVVEDLSSHSTEWEEYFRFHLYKLLDRVPSNHALEPENRLLLWRETYPREFVKVVNELFVHRMGINLKKLRTLSFLDALVLSMGPLLIYTDSRDSIGDCLVFVSSQLSKKAEKYQVFDLSCRSSLDSLESVVSSYKDGKKEWIILINCENVSCWPQILIRFLNVSYLCGFVEESKKRTNRLIVIALSSALSKLPLSIRSSPNKLAYNHKYFTPGERLDMYTEIVNNNFSKNLEECIVLMKINAVINSVDKYAITDNQNKFTWSMSFLNSVIYFLQEFFSCSSSVTENGHFLASIFSGSCLLHADTEEVLRETPVFNRIFSSTLFEAAGEVSNVSLLQIEMAASNVSVQLVKQFWSMGNEILSSRELELEPLLEMIDILIADIITLMNIDNSLFNVIVRSYPTGGLQAVLKQELRCIVHRLQAYLQLLKATRCSPYNSLQPRNMVTLQQLSFGYMPDAGKGDKEHRISISACLVWFKEALEYYRRHIEGPCPLVLRYHQHPLAWITASICQQAKNAGHHLYQCIPVAKIVTESVKEGEEQIAELHNVSLTGVIWHQKVQSYSLSPAHSLSDQKLVIYSVPVRSDKDAYQAASLYTLDITHSPVYSCELYLPLRHSSERDHMSPGNQILLLQKH